MAVLDAGIAICGKRANFFHRVIRHFIKPGTGKKKILPFYFISFKAGSPFHLPQRIGDDVLCRVAFLSFLTRNPSQGKFVIFIASGSRWDNSSVETGLSGTLRSSALEAVRSSSPKVSPRIRCLKETTKLFFICPTALKNKKDGNQQHLPAFTHGVSPIILSAGRFPIVL